METSIRMILAQIAPMCDEHESNIRRGLGFSNVRRHIKVRHATLYVRVGMWFTKETQVCNSLCLSSITVPDRYQRKGFATKLLGALEEFAESQERVFSIESVLNEPWAASIERRGYLTKEAELSTYYRLPGGNLAGAHAGRTDIPAPAPYHW